MAAALLGSAEQVRVIMQASEDDFLQYCDGRKEPSWTEFDRLVTVIVVEQRKIIAVNRDLIARIRANNPGA
jgi:hypothetical protein